MRNAILHGRFVTVDVMNNNFGGDRFRQRDGGSEGASRGKSVITRKTSGKTINVENNYALAA